MYENRSLIRGKEVENIDICFYEPDEILAGRLLDYWMANGLEKYCVSYYSNEELLLDFFTTGTARLWILDEHLRERLPEIAMANVLWLSENPDAIDTVFKFRSASILLQTIIHYLEADKGKMISNSQTQLISLYTPVKHSLQTSFGVVASHLLSHKGRTLYLNLEGYSGFSEMLTGYYSKDISDFIYSIYHSKEKFPFNTANFIYRFGEIDMIPPVLNPMNLQEISKEMWQHVLVILLESNMYNYIVVDISDFVQGIFDFLKVSRVVFSLTKSDALAERKWQQYQMLLEGLGLDSVLQKLHKISVPQGVQIPATLEEYTPGVFSDYVERSLREVGVL